LSLLKNKKGWSYLDYDGSLGFIGPFILVYFIYNLVVGCNELFYPKTHFSLVKVILDISK